MKQTEAVKEFLEQHGEITSADAIYKLSITRLADVIYKLKKEGVEIETNSRSVETPYGKTEVAVYSLKRM